MYSDKNDAARSALLNRVSDDLQELVCSYDEESESATVVMRLLKEKHVYETTTSTIQLFKEFSELRVGEVDVVSNHIILFKTAYFHIYIRCSGSTPEAIVLQNFLSVEQVKVMDLFLSLPPSYNNMIDNLTTKEDLRFANVNRRLLDMNSSKLNGNSTSSKAHFGNEKSNNKDKVKECT